MSDMGAAANTDRELWREPTDEIGREFYQPSIHVTEHGGVGINVGGHVIVLSLRAWHAMAKAHLGPPPEPSPEHLRHKYEPHADYPWFCEHCGYPEYETLKHTLSDKAAPAADDAQGEQHN
jgi:hypothetical protein